MVQSQVVKSSEINSQQVSWTQRFGDWLNAPFPFYLNDDRKNFLLVTVLSAFVTLFLYLFKTESEFSFANGLEWLHGLITFGALLFNLLVLPRIFPALMDPTAWTIKKYIVFNVWHLVLIWAIATVLEKMFFCPFDMGWITVMRQQSLREAIKTNQELQKIQVLKREAKEAIKTASQITLYSDTSESLTFNLPDLLFIEADDNYSTVMWKEAGAIQKKLLRVNLKNLESQLDNSFTLRCHRSYIVNVNAISAISGNTNGYKLKINGSDFSIPVSRPKGKEIMEKISQLRNMMELS